VAVRFWLVVALDICLYLIDFVIFTSVNVLVVLGLVVERVFFVCLGNGFV